MNCLTAFVKGATDRRTGAQIDWCRSCLTSVVSGATQRHYLESGKRQLYLVFIRRSLRGSKVGTATHVCCHCLESMRGLWNLFACCHKQLHYLNFDCWTSCAIELMRKPKLHYYETSFAFAQYLLHLTHRQMYCELVQFHCLSLAFDQGSEVPLSLLISLTWSGHGSIPRKAFECWVASALRYVEASVQS